MHYESQKILKIHHKMSKDNIFKFADKCTDNFIEFEKSDNIAWINHHHVDIANFKLFVLLLKSSFESMKLNGCTEYRQLVLQNEWDDFLKENEEWSVIEKYEKTENVPETLLISCNIDIATELVVDGFLRNNK